VGEACRLAEEDLLDDQELARGKAAVDVGEIGIGHRHVLAEHVEPPDPPGQSAVEQLGDGEARAVG
jgi:hypothetical protein